MERGMTTAAIAEKSAGDPSIAAAPHTAKSWGKGRDFIVTSIAAVEAVRLDNGWTVSRLCRVAGVDRRQYQRIRSGILPLTNGALARLDAGIRRLRANDLLEQAPPPRIIEQGSAYATIAKGLQRRRMELGLTCEQVDYLAGFHGGYTGKLENWDEPSGRGFGEISCEPWCQALGVELAVIEGVVPMATRRMINPIPPAELARRYDANRKRHEARQRTMEAKRQAKGTGQ
jgi:transcriptional regulator with XRE-family HTH domain